MVTRSNAFGGLVASTASFVALAFACSSDRSSFDPSSGAFAEPDAAACVLTCTGDRLETMDCFGNRVPCPEGQGCLDGVCRPACEALQSAESTIGCEFYTATPSRGSYAQYGGESEEAGSCFAVLLANVWNAPAKVALEYGTEPLAGASVRLVEGKGASLDYKLLPDGVVPPGKLAIAFLAFRSGVRCPLGINAAVVDRTWLDTTGRGRSFHIKTSVPIIAYEIFPYGGASSYFPTASLLLPVAALGTNYLVLDGYRFEPFTRKGFWPYFQILATEDDTTVKVLPTTELMGGPGVPASPSLQPTMFKLAKGEYVQYAQPGEANGTTVETDKKVAVLGGTQCTRIDREGREACDTLRQELLPIRLLGNRYVATRYRDRDRHGDNDNNDANEEIVPWRILAAADGTQLTYDPPQPDAPATLDRGKWAEFWAPGPFVVTSQDRAHPVYVASYMTAGTNSISDLGDPDFVNVVPADQYLEHYLFLTDPTFGNTNLVFVRKKKPDGAFADVTLDCRGTLTGWKAVGKGGEFEMTRVDIVRGGAPVGDCDNGVLRADSTAPFGLTVWGFDPWASYGYPGGMGAKPLNDIVVPAVPH